MIDAKELIRWLQTLDEDADVAIDDGGLTLVQVLPGTDPHDKTPAGPYIEVGGIPLDEDEDEEPDPAEHFNTLPSPGASHYGQRAEELEMQLRAAGYRVHFDVPGEGFTLSLLSDPTEERVDEPPTLELQAIANELAEITNA